MRRILRKIVAGEGDQLGDLSSIADPQIVDEGESSALFDGFCLNADPYSQSSERLPALLNFLTGGNRCSGTCHMRKGIGG